jgi:hypothetical protein
MPSSSLKDRAMTDIPLTDDAAATPPLPPEFLNALVFLFVAAVLWFVVQEAGPDHDRGLKRTAFRKRRQWRAADCARLEAYPDLPPVACRLMARAKGRGRPVVPAYRPLGAVVGEALVVLMLVLEPDVPDVIWRCAMKRLPNWPAVLEALYRGELQAARFYGLASPSWVAIDRLADAFGISSSSVAQVCTRARRSPDALLEAMTLADFGRAAPTAGGWA